MYENEVIKEIVKQDKTILIYLKSGKTLTFEAVAKIDGKKLSNSVEMGENANQM